MKTHDIILKILEHLDNSLDEDKLNLEPIKPATLGISEIRWSYILEMMLDSQLVKEVKFSRGGNGRSALMTHAERMQITLRGIMYLEENTTTAKIIKAAKLLKDTIPMI